MSDTTAFSRFLGQLPVLPRGRVLDIEVTDTRVIVDLRDQDGNDSTWLIEFRVGAAFNIERIR